MKALIIPIYGIGALHNCFISHYDMSTNDLCTESELNVLCWILSHYDMSMNDLCTDSELVTRTSDEYIDKNDLYAIHVNTLP